jgi:hypothetical protein
MGKSRYNAKGRKKVETIIDNSELKKVNLKNKIFQKNFHRKTIFFTDSA